MASLTDRMLRAARLDATLYEEVEADPTTMRQAMTVVVLASIAGGIGSAQEIGVLGIVIGTVVSLIGWYVWAFITYFIGTRWLPQPSTHADVGQMLRTIGFASSPGLIQVLGIVPVLGPIARVVAAIWSLCAMVVAVRQALDYDSTGRAVAVCVVGWLVQIAIILLPLLLLGAVMVGAGGVTRSA